MESNPRNVYEIADDNHSTQKSPTEKIPYRGGRKIGTKEIVSVVTFIILVVLIGVQVYLIVVTLQVTNSLSNGNTTIQDASRYLKYSNNGLNVTRREFLDKLEEHNEKVQRMIKESNEKTFEQLKQTVLASVPGTCSILYNNACYWISAVGEGTTDFADAELLCLSRGGRLADIIDAKHMNMSIEFSRNWFSKDSDQIMGFYINGEYDKKSPRLLPWNLAVKDVLWADGYPTEDDTSRKLALQTNGFSSGGYVNIRPSAKIFGAWCQNVS